MNMFNMATSILFRHRPMHRHARHGMQRQRNNLPMKPPGPSAGDPGTIFPGAKEISLFPCPGLPWASRPGTQETWPMWQCTLAPLAASLCCMWVPLVCQHGPLAHMCLPRSQNGRWVLPLLAAMVPPQSARAYSLAAAPWGLGEAGNFPVHPGQKSPLGSPGPGGLHSGVINPGSREKKRAIVP